MRGLLRRDQAQNHRRDERGAEGGMGLGKGEGVKGSRSRNEAESSCATFHAFTLRTA